MDPLTLYAIAACSSFSADPPPCSASIYYDNTPAPSYAWGKNRCLHAARRAEAVYPQYKVYCIGNNGVSLSSSGQVVDRDAYYKAIADWHERQDRKKQLSAGAR